MKKFFILSTLVCCFSNCSFFEHKKIIITKDYIINENWINDHNGIFIERMKVKQDSIINILDVNFDGADINSINIVNKLEKDSLFFYSYNVGKTYDSSMSLSKLSEKKIYFHKPNEGLWVKGRFSGDTVKVLGSLGNNKWYKFSNLKSRTKFFVFIYVDTTGQVHRFDQDLSNY
ncbi:hypothetical protein [uncultured Tenacibaculum sp.]|uniref:hypothetical protein n=1 Tax=uncultured Tenacibaculum sp. TaxID=174713 RepID=UPI002635DFA6|nr:hypothetical protein [uncultured Tenacibaculum sp.]